MMKVAVVGLDDEYVAEFAKNLAEVFNIQYINFDDELCEKIVMLRNTKLEQMLYVLEQTEKELLSSCLSEKNFVISVKNSTFISNANYKYFKNVLTICIEKDSNEKTFKNIQNLIKKHCKIKINQEKIDINEVKNEILNYFNENK